MANFIFSNNSEDYLDQVATSLIELQEQNKEKEITVVMTNYRAIEILKQKMLEAQVKKTKIDSVILPNFIKPEDLIQNYLFKIDIKNFPAHKHIITMSQIASDYSEIKYSHADYLEIAEELVELFWKFKKSEISFDNLDQWVQQDLAEHWWLMAKFLKHCFVNYEEYLKSFKAQNISYDSANNIVVLCGITEGLELLRKFLEKDGNLYIIPPPLCTTSYDLRPQFIEYYENYSQKPSSKSDAKNCTETFEFNDLFEEASFICDKVIQTKESISIITENKFLESILSSIFLSRNIDFSSSFGKRYINFAESRFFLSLAKIRTSEDFLEEFISLLSTNFLFELSEIRDFLIALNSKAKQYNSIEQIYSDEKLEIAPNVKILLQELLDWIRFDDEKLSNQLQKNYQIFLKFNKLFNCKSRKIFAEKFKEFIEDTISIENNNRMISRKDYTEYLIKLFCIKYSAPFNRNVRIFILNYDDSLIIDTKNIIFADFNEESILKKTQESVWLSSKILKKLDMTSDQELFNKKYYIVYCKTQKQKIIITRSNYDQGVIQEKCSILDFIEHENKKIQQTTEDKTLYKSKYVILSSNDLPNLLYATNIELLIRNPYGFYAKKILNLREKKNILTKINTSDFGTIVHNLIERITKYHTDDYSNIVRQSLNERYIPIFYQELWTDRIIKILNYIHIMNIEAISNNFQIYTEIEGKTELSITGENIQISAIADRIEVSDNLIRIIDFKTGAPPSEADVICGKSPQLIIEAIILLSNGFQNIKPKNGVKIELIYTKISTKEPYVESRTIKLRDGELELQKEGLIKFLEHYYSEEEITISCEELQNFWISEYDDYKHLRRTVKY